MLARDRFGIKPLYYRARRRRAVASPPSCDALPRGELDLDALEAFLAFNSIPAPLLDLPRRSASCPPGHVLVWEERRGHARALRAARPAAGRAAPTTRPSSSRSAARGCATRCGRISSRDVPVGVLLSGGVDSGVARRARRARRASEPVRTFSIGFEEQSFDELDRRARGRRALRDASTTSSSLRPDAALLLPALADAFDEPFADSSALPTYLVSQLAAEDVKVALSGEGGDELFGGYYTYAADLLAERFGPLARARAPAGRAAAVLVAAGEPRLPREALRAGGAPAAARAAPRLEGDLLGRRARRADRAPRAFDPLDALARALRRDRGRRRCWPGCRTSTSASTSPTTCS